MSKSSNAYTDHMNKGGWELQTKPLTDFSKHNDTVRIVEAVELLHSLGLVVVSKDFGKSE